MSNLHSNSLKNTAARMHFASAYQIQGQEQFLPIELQYSVATWWKYREPSVKIHYFNIMAKKYLAASLQKPWAANATLIVLMRGNFGRPLFC